MTHEILQDGIERLCFFRTLEFSTYLDDDKTVRLFIRSLVSLKTLKISRDRTIEMKMNLLDHARGDVSALLSDLGVSAMKPTPDMRIPNSPSACK